VRRGAGQILAALSASAYTAQPRAFGRNTAVALGAPHEDECTNRTAGVGRGRRGGGVRRARGGHRSLARAPRGSPCRRGPRGGASRGQGIVRAARCGAHAGGLPGLRTGHAGESAVSTRALALIALLLGG